MRLNNPKDKESIQENLRQGEATEFWQLILQGIDDSIEYLQNLRDGEDINDLPADEYKITAELLKAKIANMKKMKDFPQSLITYLDSPDQREGNFDPYYTADEIAKARREGTEH